MHSSNKIYEADQLQEELKEESDNDISQSESIDSLQDCESSS